MVSTPAASAPGSQTATLSPAQAASWHCGLFKVWFILPNLPQQPTPWPSSHLPVSHRHHHHYKYLTLLPSSAQPPHISSFSTHYHDHDHCGSLLRVALRKWRDIIMSVCANSHATKLSRWCNDRTGLPAGNRRSVQFASHSSGWSGSEVQKLDTLGPATKCTRTHPPLMKHLVIKYVLLCIIKGIKML